MAGKKDSPVYIAGFAVAVCLVCSLGVSGAAIFLKSRQEENATVARQKKVLDVAGLLRPGQELGNDDVQALFEERLVPALVDRETGELVADVDGVGPADYEPMEAAKANNLVAPANAAKVRFQPSVAKVYFLIDEKGAVKKVILPIEGYGLWGFLYGYLAMEADGVTIAGITYYEHAETPGLGGEVDNPNWKGSWKGKKAFQEGSDEVAIEVVKNARGEFQVDALTGATITSRGVTNMMDFWLGQNGYGPFLNKIRQSGPPQLDAAPAEEQS
ncbi:Na(+)-translocating NADH-quinone reductase subunit C [Pseudenhygromyxa sp. WMMC2535]|uniref:Na(+)-translocating NADH-quinone reductase subunit C n=1 Tax=Pseudenhygromyxa sp. WMMC2535 TaxID=2712867 RepID=UPI001552FB85|nr:Na(+)-translocating NADH-quinone reductase subunit C [Pseudenhygromyxa sp. WMMC2535]NVB41880.1 Na(+)-translocating NADH-quinone reductase subunit C [Pseudenhygromyxa sp. WMMC2535]